MESEVKVEIEIQIEIQIDKINIIVHTEWCKGCIGSNCKR